MKELWEQQIIIKIIFKKYYIITCKLTSLKPYSAAPSEIPPNNSISATASVWEKRFFQANLCQTVSVCPKHSKLSPAWHHPSHFWTQETRNNRLWSSLSDWHLLSCATTTLVLSIRHLELFSAYEWPGYNLVIKWPLTQESHPLSCQKFSGVVCKIGASHRTILDALL